MFSKPMRAYEAGIKATATGRELEAAALFKAARLLESCRDAWAAPERAAKLNEALRYNQRLWTIFQVELGRPDHGLPDDLRLNLLRLGAFVDRRTFDLISDPAPEKLDALIGINRNIASGLSTVSV